MRTAGQLGGVRLNGVELQNAGSWTQNDSVVSVTNENNETTQWTLSDTDLTISWGFCDHIAGPILDPEIIEPPAIDPCTPDSDRPQFKYLSAKFKTDFAKRRALTPGTDNVCADTAYYQTVDPRNRRDSIDKWLRVHGFLTPGAPQVIDDIDRSFLAADVIQAEYHNMYDLGFGRDMYCKKDGLKNDTFPCIVQNYNVSADLTQAASEPASLIVSVAMEFLETCQYNAFGLGNGKCGATAFYVFDNEGRRINSVDLDGTGRKNVPGTCLACHDGSWDENSRAADRGEYLPFDGAYSVILTGTQIPASAYIPPDDPRRTLITQSSIYCSGQFSLAEAG